MKKNRNFGVGLGLLLVFAISSSVALTQSRQQTQQRAAETTLAEQKDALQLVTNVGQWKDSSALMRAQIPGGEVEVKKDGFTIKLPLKPEAPKLGPEVAKTDSTHSAAWSPEDDFEKPLPPPLLHSVDFRYRGGSSAGIKGINPSKKIFNYYRGKIQQTTTSKCPPTPAGFIPSFTRASRRKSALLRET